MNPWKAKEVIDVALGMLDRAGFRVDTHHYYPEMLCLFTKGSNEHGFANDIVLETFRDWQSVVIFMAGWNMAQLAKALSKVKVKK